MRDERRMGHRAKDIEPSLALRASLMLSMSLALRVSLVYSFNHGQQPNDARSANDGTPQCRSKAQ